MELVAKPNRGELAAGPFRFVEGQMLVVSEPTEQEWHMACAAVGRAANSALWWYGDLLAFGYANYGEVASQWEPDSLALSTLYSARYVSEKVPPEVRRPHLGWEIHHTVASMNPEDQERWLQWADENRPSVRAFRRAVRNERAGNGHWDQEKATERLQAYIERLTEELPAGGGWPVDVLANTLHTIADALTGA